MNPLARPERSVYEAAVVLNVILGALAFLSFGLTLWQWLVARRFPLHSRISAGSFSPAVTLLKPLKGLDTTTEDCLRSWFTQQYPGPVQLLLGVSSETDPVYVTVRKLLAEFPACDARLILCGPPSGLNPKAAKLAELERLAKHDLIITSDADVRVPPDFVLNVVAPLADSRNGLVTCFYQLANPTTTAMRWEAIAINADFWSQVLQARSLKPLDFALGAVMTARRPQLQEIGGFDALANFLADDYQLGNRLSRKGYRIVLCPVPVECWSAPMNWAQVWKHQLRWARTVRVSQPLPYFFSILNNAVLWPVLWVAANPSLPVLALSLGCCLVRVVVASNLQLRLTWSRTHFGFWWLVPLKDLLQVGIWLFAFTGNQIEWGGQKMTLRRDGTLLKS